MREKSFWQSLRAQTLALGALALFAGNWSADRARQVLNTHSQEVLALQKEAIFGLLGKYRLMTILISQRPEVSQMFETNAQQSVALNSFAGRLAAMSGAKSVWFALPDGTLIAQSSLDRMNRCRHV